MIKLARIVGFSSPLALFLIKAGGVFAQSATSGAGATSGALPSAGSTEITYFVFLGGVALFVFGTLKLILSYRE